MAHLNPSVSHVGRRLSRRLQLGGKLVLRPLPWSGLAENMMAGQFGWGALLEEGWRKGPWTAQEDELLVKHVHLYGEGRWNSVSNFTGLRRSGKSCRLRWVNYLRPDLKRGKITPHEESIIIKLHARWGNRWSAIARTLPGRTDNEIKNYWRTHFKKATCSKNLEKARATRLLRQQQEQQQQPQQQRGELQDIHQGDMTKRIISMLGEDEYWPAASTPQSVPDLLSYMPYMLQTDAFFADEECIDEAGGWGCLWNLDDVHAAAAVSSTRGGGARQQDHFTSCYMGGLN